MPDAKAGSTLRYPATTSAGADDIFPRIVFVPGNSMLSRIPFSSADLCRRLR